METSPVLMEPQDQVGHLGRFTGFPCPDGGDSALHSSQMGDIQVLSQGAPYDGRGHSLDAWDPSLSAESCVFLDFSS
jgi:hypothetical protein